jgi:uncharacterized protein (TIRG00374 family)
MNLTKKLILFSIAGIGIYSIILLFTDLALVAEQFKNFKTEFLFLIMPLIFSSWLILYLRWAILLKNYNIKIPIKKNIMIYLAGFALAISPAKSGELIKSVILKEKFNIPHSHSVPIIAMERFYDVIGTLVIVILGLWFLGISYVSLVIAASLILVFIFCMVYSNKIFNKFLKILGRFRSLKKFTGHLISSQQIIKESSKGKIAVISSLLTISYRLVESFAIYFVLLGFSIDALHYLKIVATYSLSIIAGNVSFVPGGLGVTEGSLAGLFSLQGLSLSTSIALAIASRLFTLWFGVFVGFVCLKLTGILSNRTAETID